MKTVVAALALVVASGCEVWDPRPALRDFFWGMGDQSIPDPHAAIRQKEYPTWPEPIRKAVDERLVQVGMTKNQALLALRLAEEDIQKQVTDTGSGKTETWTVWKVPNGWTFTPMPTKRRGPVPFSERVTIVLRDGVVAQIDFSPETEGLEPATARPPEKPLELEPLPPTRPKPQHSRLR